MDGVQTAPRGVIYTVYCHTELVPNLLRKDVQEPKLLFCREGATLQEVTGFANTHDPSHEVHVTGRERLRFIRTHLNESPPEMTNF